MVEQDKKPTSAPQEIPRDDLERLRREAAEISRKVAQDIEALRRRDPKDRLTRWR